MVISAAITGGALCVERASSVAVDGSSVHG